MRIDDGKARASCFVAGVVQRVPTFRCGGCSKASTSAGRKRLRLRSGLTDWVCVACQQKASNKP